MYLDHEEVSFDRLALLDDPSHEILDLRADSKFRSGQGSGKQKMMYDPSHEVLYLGADSKFRSGQGSGNRKLKRFDPKLFVLSFFFPGNTEKDYTELLCQIF